MLHKPESEIGDPELFWINKQIRDTTMNKKIPTFKGGEEVSVTDMSDHCGIFAPNSFYVPLSDVQKLANERDEAFAEVHRLRNFIQALYGKERRLQTLLLQGTFKPAPPHPEDPNPVVDAKGTIALVDRGFLLDCREVAVDKAAENFDYEALGYAYEADSGWEGVWTSDSVSKPVFLYPIVKGSADYKGPTIKKTLVVEFNEDDLINPVKSIYLV